MKYLQRFKELLHASLKSRDTEEWLDVYFTRPIGLLFALLWNRLGIHPNVITMLSIVLGVAGGVMFYFSDLTHTLLGILLLMLANFCDSTDGQMARLSGKKTLIGRMLDGLSSDLWFAAVYIAIAQRLFFQPMPVLGFQWGAVAWLLVLVAGIKCHAKQSALADYYRQIHLYVLLGKSGSELDRSSAQKKLVQEKTGLLERIFYWNYTNYCSAQEKRTPEFQQLYQRMHSTAPAPDKLPSAWRDEFLAGSRPLMKYTNLLTFNARAITLYLSALLDCIWLYPLIEMTAFELLYRHMRQQHEQLCRKMQEALQPIKAIAFDYGATLDTAGVHWAHIIYAAYRKAGLSVSEEVFREAYVQAERRLGSEAIIQPSNTFRQTLIQKITLQFALLHLEDETEAFQQIVDDCYEQAQQQTTKNREVLQKLEGRYRLALVSNFYGNILTVLEEFYMKRYFDVVIESATEGIRKPNPELYRLAAERLKVDPQQLLVVGDSFEKDIRPAATLGCKTVWLEGRAWKPETIERTLPTQIINQLNELFLLDEIQ